MRYEEIRQSNIERNKEFLSQIGLNSLADTTRIPPAGRKKRPRVDNEEIVPTRRSLRIAELPAPSYKVAHFFITFNQFRDIRGRITF